MPRGDRAYVEFNAAVIEYKNWMAGTFAPEMRKGAQENFFNHYAPFIKSITVYLLAFLFGCGFWMNWSQWARRTALYLVVLAGVLGLAVSGALGALTGHRHGGLTARVAALFDESGDPMQVRMDVRAKEKITDFVFGLGLDLGGGKLAHLVGGATIGRGGQLLQARAHLGLGQHLVQGCVDLLDHGARVAGGVTASSRRCRSRC